MGPGSGFTGSPKPETEPGYIGLIKLNPNLICSGMGWTRPRFFGFAWVWVKLSSLIISSSHSFHEKNSITYYTSITWCLLSMCLLIGVKVFTSLFKDASENPNSMAPIHFYSVGYIHSHLFIFSPPIWI